MCVAIQPTKADSPLVVDANAVLTAAVAGESFEAIPWRNAQIGQRFCRIENQQLPQRCSLNRLGKPRPTFATKNMLCLTVAKAANHCSIITHGVNNVKRYCLRPGDLLCVPKISIRSTVTLTGHLRMRRHAGQLDRDSEVNTPQLRLPAMTVVGLSYFHRTGYGTSPVVCLPSSAGLHLRMLSHEQRRRGFPPAGCAPPPAVALPSWVGFPRRLLPHKQGGGDSPAALFARGQ